MLFCKINPHKILSKKISLLANRMFTIVQVLVLSYLFSGPLAFTSWGWTNHFPMRTNPRWRRHLQKTGIKECMELVADMYIQFAVQLCLTKLIKIFTYLLDFFPFKLWSISLSLENLGNKQYRTYWCFSIIVSCILNSLA